MSCYLALVAVAFVLAACAHPRLDSQLPPTRSGTSDVELVALFDLPPMHVTVSETGRIFLDAFGYASTRPPHLAELIDRELRVFLPPQSETDLDTVHGLRIDGSERLWVLDYGRHRFFGVPKLVAYSVRTGERIHSHVFSRDEAGFGSMLNDLIIDESRSKVYISDTSPIAGRPAVLVYDIAQQTARRVLESHASVRASKVAIFVNGRRWRVLGLIEPSIGIDGIALDRGRGWLYYSASTSGLLFRIPVDALNDASLTPETLAESVQFVARIPMTDGMSADVAGNVYLTAFEHSAIVRWNVDGSLETLFQDPACRWPGGLSFGTDGWLYFTCNAIDEVALKSEAHIRRRGPYALFRLNVRIGGTPGH